ncbi:MAG: hypothetical protein J0M08_11640 [Bacteroidetes bacterium]|nr:hypothetical protein [Bacteroidota bacterium]
MFQSILNKVHNFYSFHFLFARRISSGIFLLLLFSISILNSQTTAFSFYGVEHGIAQAQIQALQQDNDGNLWIGTLGGLTKYNGKQFVNYTKKQGLAEDWVTCSYKDKEGNLLFGHWAGGVTKYISKTKQFQNLELEKQTYFKSITAINQDSKGNYWIATEGAGVFVYDTKINKLAVLSKKKGLPTNNFYSIENDSAGNIWLASDTGVFVYRENISENSYTLLNKSKGLPSNKITSIKLINKNEVWLGTADEGVFVFWITDMLSMKTAASVVSNTSFHFTTQNGLSSNFVESLYKDSKGNIWVATTGGGAVKCQPDTTSNRLEAIKGAQLFTYSTKQGLAYFNTNRIFESNEGSVWIATDVGLNQYRGERFQLYSISDSLINNLTWAVACDMDNSIWIGTNEGVSKLTFANKNTTNKTFYSENFTIKDGLVSNVVMAVHQDLNGNMWFGTANGGLSKLPKNQRRFETINKSSGLASDVIYSITSDNNGSVWIGTKEGASFYDAKTKQIKNYTLSDGLGGNTIYRVFHDSKGRVWFGALGGELSYWDGTKIKKLTIESDLKHRFILCINEDKEGHIWFGTHGGGLFRYDGATLTNFTTVDGLSTNSPYSIVCDNDGNIWVGHNKGLDRYNVKEHVFNFHEKQDGFWGGECNPNAACKDKQGNLWFGTINGTIKFNPAEIKANPIPPITIITGLKLFMKPIDFPEDARFEYNQNHLTFSFVGISLASPKKVAYLYKLEGFDTDWSPESTTANEVSYTNLQPGKYTMLVKSCNNSGVWGEPVKYKFYITPPFWQTAIFYILVVCVSAFLLYKAHKVRTKNLADAKKELQDTIKKLQSELDEYKKIN